MATNKLAYSVLEMAEALSIGKTAAYELVKREGFPKVVIGTRIVIPIARLEAWLETEAAKNTEVHI